MKSMRPEGPDANINQPNANINQFGANIIQTIQVRMSTPSILHQV